MLPTLRDACARDCSYQLRLKIGFPDKLHLRPMQCFKQPLAGFLNGRKASQIHHNLALTDHG